MMNVECMTFVEWCNAVRAWGAPLPRNARAKWLAGEDPTEYGGRA